MARKVKVDFTGVESFQRVSEGIHTVKIVEVKEATSQGGDPMLKVAFEVMSGDDKGNKVIESLSLADKALWKLKSLLQCINMKCDGKVAIDLDNMIGKVLDITVVHEEYNGVTRARAAEFSKVASSKSSEDDDDIDDDFEEEEEEAPKEKKKAAPAKKSKKKPEPEPESDEDEDDWDEDEDEEEEEAPKKKAPAKKAPAKKSKKKPEPEEEDEDEDDDDDWEED